MKYIWVSLITLYQRFISPYKGFHCAHHALHKGDTCSNAIKKLVAQVGFIRAWPKIRLRFKECRRAYETLQDSQARMQRSDIPCDIPCDVSFADCSSPSGSDALDAGGDCANCGSACPCDLPKFSRKTWRLIIATLLLLVLIATYWFYGRAISKVYISEIGHQQSLVSRLTQRQQPEIKVLMSIGDKRFYSNAVRLNRENSEILLRFSKAPLSYNIDRLAILDARFKLSGDTVVLSQVLEDFANPDKDGQGKRFTYRLERRWHFY